jgi:hypothetical protein
MTKLKNVCLVVAPPITVVKETLVNNAVPTDKTIDEVSHEELSGELSKVGLRLENDPSINEEPAPKAGTSFEKSPFNFLPAMTDTEFTAVKEDIRKHGYDKRFPIWKFEGKLLDGWHKDRACRELFAEGYTDDKYKPIYREFKGTVRQAKEFVARSAKGRNLNPEQLGMIAIHETPEYLAEIIETVKKEAKENSKKKRKNFESSSPTPKKDKNKTKSKKKIADTFGSTPNIMDTILKYKDKISPEEFDQLAYDIEHKITTLKQFEAKLRAEKKFKEQPLIGDDNKPKDKKPFIPALTEKSLSNLIEKATRKVIELQKEKKVIEEDIQNLGAGDTKELKEKRSSLIYDIHSYTFEFGYQLIFKTKYKKNTMKDFNEMAIL